MLAENLENWAKKERQEERQEEREKVMHEAEQRVREAEQRVLENKLSAARRLIARTEMGDQLIAEIEELPVEEVARLRAESQH